MRAAHEPGGPHHRPGAIAAGLPRDPVASAPHAALYRLFMPPGAVVFTSGRTWATARALAALGCRVTRSSHPTRARARLLFGRNPQVEVVEAAATGAGGEEYGRSASERRRCRRRRRPGARRARAGLGGGRNRRNRVRTVTADALIAQYAGRRSSRSTSGGEPAVLDGLRYRAGARSALPGAIDEVRACVDGLRRWRSRPRATSSTGRWGELRAGVERLDASSTSPRSPRSEPPRDRRRTRLGRRRGVTSALGCGCRRCRRAPANRRFPSGNAVL
jgi:hypothetical protein